MKTHKEFIPVLIAIIFVALPTILCIIRTDNLEKKVDKQEEIIAIMADSDSLMLENILNLSKQDYKIIQEIYSMSKTDNDIIDLINKHLEYNH